MLGLPLQPEQVAAPFGILYVDSGHAGAYLVLGHVFAAAFHACHRAAVAIGVIVLDKRLLLEAEVGEGFALAFAEGLLALRSIDGMDAHLHLFIGAMLAAARSECVAV